MFEDTKGVIRILDPYNLATFYWNFKPDIWAVMYLCAMVIDFASLCDFSIGFWSCYDSV